MRRAGTLAPLLAALTLGACAPVPGTSTIRAFDVPATCPVSASGFRANDGLTRSRAALGAGELTILAVGSSSIEGVGASLAAVSGTIAYLGTREGYAVDQRFSPMSGWAGLEGGGVGPDDLHLNDAGYACWAANTVAGLGDALRQ